MATLLGKYLRGLGVVKARVGSVAKVKKPRMNDLCNKDTAKPSPEEFYRIIMAALKFANREESELSKAIDQIFPDRPKFNFLNEFNHLPAEIRFLKRYTQKQNDVESKIGMAEGKISRLASEKVKDLLAVELICFIEGTGLDVLDSFKEIYGEVTLDDDENQK